MRYCYEIFKSARAIEDRRASVELLRVVADRRALAWVVEFLDDQDAEIQSWGVGVVDQLLWSNLIESEEAEDLLQKSEQHENKAVREWAEFVRGFLRARAEREIQTTRSKKVTVETSTGRRVRVGSFVRVTRVPPGYSALTRESKRTFRKIVGRRFRVVAIGNEEPRWLELNVGRVVD